jgi:hypothetical protein
LSSLERDHVPSARPLAAKETQLIDRVNEMELLKEAVDRAIQGEGGLVFLPGEAGMVFLPTFYGKKLSKTIWKHALPSNYTESSAFIRLKLPS